MTTEVLTFMNQAYEAISLGEYEEAIKLGKQLQKLRHSSCFEIIALAYEASGKIDKAIQTLKEGVETVPALSFLWELLGNFQSNAKQFKEAYAAYESGLNCPDADANSLHLNWAIALDREQKYPEALEHLNKMNLNSAGKAMSIACHSAKAGALNSMQKFHEALKIAYPIIEQIENTPDYLQDCEGSEHYIASLYAEKACALLKTGQNLEQVTTWITKAIQHDRTNHRVQTLLRETRGLRSQNAQRFQMLITGEWPWPMEDSQEEMNFFSNYIVVADSKEEALTFIKDFEPQETWPSLSIEECSAIDKQPNVPKGVYANSGYTFFLRNEKD